ncbi:hypothetical protein JM93_02986 [Roseibium hamelinense]|uniref:DUF6460 domain-containing protein n=1 Tax=Roseibium hamelinense TaxID=150831 RepID=A0A562STV9_9HYPH|nr:DUF6460 domain-containing protein [Roseibium hamelinense]MTI43045.1 integrase [Roseibium hamelinense]TWI84652.1 hypothetical protein JM93_02986 [Roseibium hamelinense]
MSDQSLSRFLGGSPGQVILRLVFLSFVVGVILSALNLDPLDIVDLTVRFFERLWNMGFAALDNVARYFVMGAIIVVPIWLLMRLLALSKRD